MLVVTMVCLLRCYNDIVLFAIASNVPFVSDYRYNNPHSLIRKERKEKKSIGEIETEKKREKTELQEEWKEASIGRLSRKRRYVD